MVLQQPKHKTPYEPRDHNGDMHAEMMDIHVAIGELTRVHLQAGTDSSIGATQVIEVYSEVVCVEVEDYYRKRKLEEEFAQRKRSIERQPSKPTIHKKALGLMLSHRFQRHSNKLTSQKYGDNHDEAQVVA